MAELGPFYWFALAIFSGGIVLVFAPSQHKWGVFLTGLGLLLLAVDQRQALEQQIALLTGSQASEAITAPSALHLAFLCFAVVAVGSAIAGLVSRIAKRGAREIGVDIREANVVFGQQQPRMSVFGRYWWVPWMLAIALAVYLKLELTRCESGVQWWHQDADSLGIQLRDCRSQSELQSRAVPAGMSTDVYIAQLQGELMKYESLWEAEKEKVALCQHSTTIAK